MEFDKKKRLELIKEAQKIIKHGKFISDPRVSSKELRQYISLLENNLFWRDRLKYLQIVELFVNKHITISEFISECGQLDQLNIDMLNKWRKNLESTINVELNPQSDGFTRIISLLNESIDSFNPEINFLSVEEDLIYGSYGRNEEFSRLYIKNNILPQLNKYYKNF